MFGKLVGWLLEFYGISNIVGYSTPNSFLYKQSVIFQTIQYKYRFCLHTVKYQNSSILNNSV